jgi:hypothetical protein
MSLAPKAGTSSGLRGAGAGFFQDLLWALEFSLLEAFGGEHGDLFSIEVQCCSGREVEIGRLVAPGHSHTSRTCLALRNLRRLMPRAWLGIKAALV